MPSMAFVALVTALLFGQAQAPVDPFPEVLRKCEGYVRVLTSGSPEAKIAVYREWMKTVGSDEERLTVGSNGVYGDGDHWQLLSQKERTNRSEEYGQLVVSIGAVVSTSLSRGDKEEYLAALRWMNSQHSYFHKDTWDWPSCGNHALYLNGEVDWRDAQYSRPKWAQELLEDLDLAVSARTAFDLERINPDLIREKATSWLDGPRPKLRSVAFLLLAYKESRDPDSDPILNFDVIRQALGDPVKELRQQACDLVRGFAAETEMFTLDSIHRFREASPELKWSTLSLTNSLVLAPEVEKLRHDSNVELRSKALYYLAKIGRETDSDEVRFCITHENDYYRTEWIYEAAKHPDMWPDIVPLLVGENEAAAWDTLGRIATPHEIPWLIETYSKQRDEDGRRILSKDPVVKALRRLSPTCDSSVRDLFHRSDSDLRKIAIGVACGKDVRSFGDIREAAMRDPNPDLRECLADNLPSAGYEFAWQRLQKLATDPVQSVRVSAVESMGKVATENDLPYLSDLTKSSDKAVANAAEMAIDRAKDRLHPENSQ